MLTLFVRFTLSPSMASRGGRPTQGPVVWTQRRLHPSPPCGHGTVLPGCPRIPAHGTSGWICWIRGDEHPDFPGERQTVFPSGGAARAQVSGREWCTAPRGTENVCSPELGCRRSREGGLSWAPALGRASVRFVWNHLLTALEGVVHTFPLPR